MILEKEAQYLSSEMLSAGLFVVHNATRRGQHEEPELTRRQERRQIRLHVPQLKVESRTDYTAFVQSSGQIHHDFATSVVVNDLELADVA